MTLGVAQTPAADTTSWLSLPNKSQLAVVVMARLAEPLTERALTSYVFFQLRWLSPGLPDSAIAGQAAALTAAFAAAQCVTAMLWGRAADSPLLGRKRVLIIGLLGSCLAILGVGLSTSFRSVMFFRILAGGLNGNVGVLRTMISETVPDKRYRARAFLLLPMTFNVGVIIGPLMGGFLAEPAKSFPSLFGPGSVFGGEDGVWWMIDYPFLLPNLVCAIFLFLAVLGVILLLRETHPLLRHERDRGREFSRYLSKKLFRKEQPSHEYEIIPDSDDADEPRARNDEEEDGGQTNVTPPKPQAAAPLRALCTRRIAFSLMQNALSTLHVSAFNSMLFVLLPAARVSRDGHGLLSGGLGLSAQKIGIASTIIGIVGLPLQILFFPLASSKLGVLRCYLIFLPFGALAYLGLPWLTLVASHAEILWPCLALILSAQVLSRTFVGPATVMLVNEAAPEPTLLGTVHGIATSTSAAARVVGPSLGAALLGWGLQKDMVGVPFWIVTMVSIVNWVILWFIDDVKLS